MTTTVVKPAPRNREREARQQNIIDAIERYDRDIKAGLIERTPETAVQYGLHPSVGGKQRFVKIYGAGTASTK